MKYEVSSLRAARASVHAAAFVVYVERWPYTIFNGFFKRFFEVQYDEFLYVWPTEVWVSFTDGMPLNSSSRLAATLNSKIAPFRGTIKYWMG